MYTLYMHVTPSNKKYVGITRNKVTARWRRGNGYTGNAHFYNAIQKYGWDNIDHVVLKTGLTKEEAKRQEIFLISQYETRNPNKGYNKTDGGDTNVPLFGEKNGMYGNTHTPEVRERLRRSALKRFENKENHPMYRKPRSEETKRKLRESHKGLHEGKNNYFYGKNKSGKDSWRYGSKHSEETKQKLSEIRKGKYRGAAAYNSRSVRCVETGEVFSCAMEVKRKLGYCNSTIGKCCRGIKKEAYGLHWEFADKK